ncbi:MAG: Methionine-tRNA ligase [candidate division CPR2 bacterium GW2011_GWC1_39_9]|uniref:Methionine--tRNA ligase n=1 Tax=candidate division CPR2 bacterium GW2011_GWC2_39_10 TaxID=1618345 RepID=A0A0G0M0A4_UNCC2|nr:MAG: Methionine-tRNA ligase [candidate division CPR2 bacterium GW2011_GWC2_39_10]KKR34428.1 MAG: Methionine-tRNA ligase [candidate division CPR2 bacterium GW2011_GWC1_39_9]
MSKFYITTPIYYASGQPHIGHAYTTVAADVLARYHRLIGDNVFFLTGMDEHGLKIQQKAEEQKKTPQEFVDEIAESFKLAWEKLNIKYDNFIRTVDEKHVEGVKEVITKLFEAGYIEKGKYEALYCVGCEQYKTRSELVEGKCPDHLTEPELKFEEAYLFKMSKFKNQILDIIKNDKVRIKPDSRKNEIISFLEREGLNDIAFSRLKKNVYWGIDLPFDGDHTTYVWADAFLNYLTGLGWPQDKEKYEQFWPPNVQLMAKDIFRVHATIWLSMLLAMKEELPQEMFVHGYFTSGGQKMSKSIGNVINPLELVDKYGADFVRYILLKEMVFGSDGDLTLGRIAEKYEADFAKGLGNFSSRVLKMIEKYSDSIIPQDEKQDRPILDSKRDFSENNEAFWALYEQNLSGYAYNLVLSHSVFNLAISENDKYIEQTKPWEIAKSGNEKKLFAVLYYLAESLRQITIAIYPFMPETANKIREQLGIKKIDENNFDFYNEIKWGGLKPGTKIGKIEALFPRIEN